LHRNIPRGHTLLLVHGIFTPPGAVDSKLEDENEMLRVKDKFMSLCQRNGVPWPYTSHIKQCHDTV
jgi:hypothetical protein